MDKKKNRNFRATDAEFRKIQENAKAAGLPVSKFIRSRTMDQKKPTFEDAVELLVERYREVLDVVDELREKSERS